MGVSARQWTRLIVPLWNCCSYMCVCVCVCMMFMARCCCPDVQIGSLLPRHHFPQPATKTLEALFSHTQPLQSVNASPLRFSGMLFMYSSIMSQEISSSWSVHANPSPPFLGAGPVFSQGFFSVRASPAPLPFRLSQSLSTHTKYHGPQVWKPQNKKASRLFWGLLQDVQVSEDIKERGEKNATTK